MSVSVQPLILSVSMDKRIGLAFNASQLHIANSTFYR